MKYHTKQTKAFQLRLEELNTEYGRLVTSTDRQARGFMLERLAKELFELFDLEPKASFKIVGEQIGGSFVFENTDCSRRYNVDLATYVAYTIFYLGTPLNHAILETDRIKCAPIWRRAI